MVTDSKYPPSVKAGKPILGETPKGWARESLKKHLTLEQRTVKVLDEKEYDLVTVKRSRGGVVRREHLYGNQISVKSQFALKEGDFLISKRQIVHGACGIVPAHLDGSIVSNEYSIFTAKDSFDLTYLRYLSETLYFQQTCFHSSIGVHIEKMIFKLDNWFKWDFNLPPLPEQRKIAKILSTWDKAIATTEKLIATSQQQKKALMQQLLTGKKRLLNPETGKVFEGDWLIKHLKNIGKLQAGKFVKASEIFNTEDESLFPCYGGNGLRGFTASYTHEGLYSLIGRQGALCGNITLAEGKFHATEHAVVVTPYKHIDTKWLYYKLIELDLNQYATGQAQPGLSVKNLDPLEVLVAPLKEQQKIASVLTVADKEIELLQAKLAHLKEEKKALMQQLLTGKRRVKVEQDMEIAS